MIDLLRQRAKALNILGLIAHWEEVQNEPWVTQLLGWEEEERSGRSLKSRLKLSRVGRFKPLAEFDWKWPKKCDRQAIEECMNLAFLQEAINLILCGPNGVGKSMIAQDGDLALKRKLKFYTNPRLLVIDEVGYLS